MNRKDSGGGRVTQADHLISFHLTFMATGDKDHAAETQDASNPMQADPKQISGKEVQSGEDLKAYAKRQAENLRLRS